MKNYTHPEMTLIGLEQNDVLTASGFEFIEDAGEGDIIEW